MLPLTPKQKNILDFIIIFLLIGSIIALVYLGSIISKEGGKCALNPKVYYEKMFNQSCYCSKLPSYVDLSNITIDGYNNLS